MIKNLIPKIQLSKDEQDRLKRRLKEMVDEGHSFRRESNWSELHEMYWRMFYAKPESAVKSFPWDNASNLFIPITQISILNLQAQEFDAMFSVSPNVVGFEATDLAAAEDLRAYYFDYFFKDVVPIQTLGSGILLDNAVDGTAAMKVRQNRDFQVMRVESVEDVPTYTTTDLGAFGKIDEVSDITARRVETATIERVDQTEVEITDLENIYFAPGSKPSIHATWDYPYVPWYWEQHELTWTDLLQRKKQGYEINEDLKGFMGKREPTPKDTLEKENEGVSDTEVPDTLTVCEFYMRWPLPARYTFNTDPDREEFKTGEEFKQTENDEEGYWEEIVVTYAPEADHLFLIRPLSRVSPDGTRPHCPNWYHMNPRQIYGLGVSSKMRHIQEAMNTFSNQGADFGTLASLPWALYTPSAFAGGVPPTGNIQPGQWIECQDPRGAVFPRFNTDPNFFLSQIQQMQNWGEKITAIGDTNLGRNPTTPNAPRTARGMAYQLQQANIAFSLLVSCHAVSFINMFRKVNAFHKKWAKSETMYRIFNKDTGLFANKTLTARDFQQDLDFQFTLNSNRNAEAQTNQMIYQITMQALMQAMQVPNLANTVRSLLADIYISSGKKNFDQIWPKNLIPQVTPQVQTGMQQGAMGANPLAGQGSPGNFNTGSETIQAEQPTSDEINVEVM